MNDTVVVALIIALISPSIVAVVTGWQRRQDKRAEWARADKLREIAEATLAQATATHIFVNNDKTEEMRGRLVILTALYASTKRNIAADEAAGRAPIVEDVAALKATQQEMTVLEATIAQREKDTVTADAVVAEAEVKP